MGPSREIVKRRCTGNRDARRRTRRRDPAVRAGMTTGVKAFPATRHAKEQVMSERKGSANWQGRAKEGKGGVTTESGVLKDTAFSFATRFEEDKRGTNPEELIAAAHAACFSMAF